MKKALLTICIMVFAICNAIAGPVDAQRAQQLGQRFLNNDRITLVQTSATRDAVDYYVFNVPGDNGFVIIAGDDRVKPVLAYSTTGSFDVNNLSDGFSFTLNSFSEEIQYVREHNLEATPDIVAEWKAVAENGIINQGRGNRAVVGPLFSQPGTRTSHTTASALKILRVTAVMSTPVVSPQPWDR